MHPWPQTIASSHTTATVSLTVCKSPSFSRLMGTRRHRFEAEVETRSALQNYALLTGGRVLDVYVGVLWYHSVRAVTKRFSRRTWNVDAVWTTQSYTKYALASSLMEFFEGKRCSHVIKYQSLDEHQSTSRMYPHRAKPAQENAKNAHTP
jgi:hypothetical protein